MIEALIIAALAGAVTTLVRSRSMKNRDEAVHDRTLSSRLDGVAGVVQDQDHIEGKEGRVQKSIEHRIRSMADIRLREYLHDGRISEEEYRALVKNATVPTSGMDAVRVDSGRSSDYNDGSNGNSNNSNNDHSLPHHRTEKNQNDTIMQEILLRLDRLNSRLDVLEGKIYTSMNQPSINPYTNPVIPTQEHLHIKRYNGNVGSRIKRQRLRRSSSMEGKGKDKDAITAIDRNKDEGYGHGGRDNESSVGHHDVSIVDVDVDVDVDDADNPPYVKDLGIGREEGLTSIYTDDHGLLHGDNHKDSSGNSGLTVNNTNASNNDYIDEELESIKKQIMDAIARLEKNE